MANKNININELQAQISKVIKGTQDGDIYEVMRYSEPVAVVLGYNDYLKLRGECKRCVQDLRKLVSDPSTVLRAGDSK